MVKIEDTKVGVIEAIKAMAADDNNTCAKAKEVNTSKADGSLGKETALGKETGDNNGATSQMAFREEVTIKAAAISRVKANHGTGSLHFFQSQNRNRQSRIFRLAGFVV